MNAKKRIPEIFRSVNCTLMFTVLCSVGVSTSLHAQHDRMFWNTGVGDFMVNWNGENAAPSGVAPGSVVFTPTGGARNAIAQGVGPVVNLNQDYTPIFAFDRLVIRAGAAMNINGSLYLAAAPYTALNLSDSVVNQNGHTVNASAGEIGNGSIYNLNNGGALEIVGGWSGNNTSDLNFGTGGNGQNVSLSVGGSLQINNANNNVFTVGSGSSLSLGQNTHLFADGLTATNGGTIGTGNNSAAVATLDAASGAVTLENGVTIDYSINGETSSSDEWIINSDLDIGAAPMIVNLVVDVVAGDVKQTAGPFTIFDWSAGTGPTLGEFNNITWNVTGAEGTRVSSIGTITYDSINGLIELDGFEAFSIPEPSTAMLLGMGAIVMLLRRRMNK